MNGLADRIADFVLMVPIFVWDCVCWFVKQVLRVQTIVVRSQYAVVVENGGNVAILEQWDDRRVEIHRRNFRSGDSPASVEQFMEFFPVGKMLDANTDLYRALARLAVTE